MPKSRVIAILTLFVLSAILTACGNGDDEAESTVEPTATRAPITAIAGATPTGTDAAATPDVAQNPLAAPTVERVTRPPAVMDASPTIVAVTAATPTTDPSTRVAATPAMDAAPDRPVQAVLTLGGIEQQDYLITDEGCVGLGDWRGLKPGAQVIVRDASGTVVDVGELEAGDVEGECSWMADLSVPTSEFVSISVPMITDVWFTQSELYSGRVQNTLP